MEEINMEEKQLRVVIYPWLAMGHIIPFMHLANILAERGHKVTVLLPNKAKLLVESSLNLHPSNLTLHTITIPAVHPLPPGTETVSDIPFQLGLETHLATALDLIRPEFECIISKLQPNIVLYDFAYWIPEAVAACRSEAKCVSYCVVSAACSALFMIPFREPPKDRDVNDEDSCVADIPPGYPMSTPVIMDKEMRIVLYMPYGEGVTFYQRITNSFKGSDAIIIKTYGEIEGKYCDYLSSQYNNKPVLPFLLLPKPKEAKLEPRWAEWLSHFGPGTVVFCAFGSQVVLNVAQFQEILLGFEMTKLPFLVAFKPPTGCTTVEEAFPEGFKERVGERGLVTGDWVQQPQILAHPSVGCFVSHCGWGSIWESLMSKNNLVLIPQQSEQVLNSKFLAQELKVAVEVERGDWEAGSWVSKESLCTSVISVMDQDSEISSLVKKNHENLRNKLLDPGFMHGETDRFIKYLQALVGRPYSIFCGIS